MLQAEREKDGEEGRERESERRRGTAMQKNRDGAVLQKQGRDGEPETVIEETHRKDKVRVKMVGQNAAVTLIYCNYQSMTL